MRRRKQMTYNDLKDGTDAMKYYGLSTREAEKQIRGHMYGYSRKDLKPVYKEFFKKRD